MQEQYYIDWINSLDIKDCILINTIEELYQNDNDILSNIIAKILNKSVEELDKIEQNKNLNYINIISIYMKKYFNYIYDTNDEINLKNNTILLVKFLKSNYPNSIENKNNDKINNINLRPKSSKNNRDLYEEEKNNSKNLLYENQSFIGKTFEKFINKSQPFLNINIKEEEKNDYSKYNATQIIPNNKNNNEKKMEEFILNYLYKKGIISQEQKNSNYLWKKLIPDLKDGYIIGKLINILENKSNNYLKGISKETFYKVNIYLNWKKIKDFLLTKESFYSMNLYQKNFFEKNKNIFYILYDICHYYYIKKDIKNNKIICKRSISTRNINKNNQIKKDDIKQIKDKIKLNNISTKEDIMRIRRSINYIPKNNNINNNTDVNIKINNPEIINRKNKKINNQFDKKVNIILSFLSSIGINTSQINFYSEEMKIFKDGILLFKIISQLEPNNNLLPKIDLNPKQAPNSINNHKLIINYLINYKKNFPIKYLGKERELYKAKPKFILNLLFEIKNIYKNEIYFYDKILNKNGNRKVIYPKNIDKSERLSLPLNNKLRNKFLIQEKGKIWA